MVKTIELSLSCNDAELESVKGFLTRSHIPYSLREDKEPELSWVKTEYCSLFKPYGHLPYERECKIRIQKLMKKEHITKDEILGATRLYLSRENPRYVKRPHYFLLKDSDSVIMTWIDLWRNNNSIPQQRDVTETLQ